MSGANAIEADGRYRKILIVRLGSLGDIVHTLPSQQHILQQFPDARIDWLTEPCYGPLLRSVAGISKLWLADTQKWRRRLLSARESLDLVRFLRRERFDIALDFQGLIKSAVLARLSGARRVLGFLPERLKEPAANFFYTDAVLGDDGSRPHAIDVNLQLTRFLGCRPNGISPLIPLDIPRDDIAYVDDRLEQCKVSNPVLLNPGAGWVTKRWSPRHYAELHAAILNRLGLPVVYTHGPGEEQLIETIRAEAAPNPVLIFPTNVLQFAALCRRSRLLVGGDTGPLHLAVAVGTPTVAILGPTAAWRNGPYHHHDEVVQRDLLCSNSYRRTCDQFICMNIPAEEVFAAVQRRLARANQASDRPALTRPDLGCATGPSETEKQL